MNLFIRRGLTPKLNTNCSLIHLFSLPRSNKVTPRLSLLCGTSELTRYSVTKMRFLSTTLSEVRRKQAEGNAKEIKVRKNRCKSISVITRKVGRLRVDRVLLFQRAKKCTLRLQCLRQKDGEPIRIVERVRTYTTILCTTCRASKQEKVLRATSMTSLALLARSRTGATECDILMAKLFREFSPRLVSIIVSLSHTNSSSLFIYCAFVYSSRTRLSPFVRKNFPFGVVLSSTQGR